MRSIISKLYGIGLSIICAGAFASAAKATVITTTYDGNNSFDGNYFDITVGTQKINVTGMSVNVDTGPMTIEVYDKAGTYSGSEANPSAWTLISKTQITGLGPGVPTPVAITPFTLAAGSLTGMYVTVDNNTDSAPYMYYSGYYNNGNGLFSNGDLSIQTGAASGGLFSSIGIYASRTWNGSISYNTTLVPEPATNLMMMGGIAAFGAVGLRRRQRA